MRALMGTQRQDSKGSDGDAATPRRGFFRDALRRTLAPLVDLVEGAGASAEEPAGGHADEELLLRPPGAIDEAEFATTCMRCGACVEACPADAIFAAPATAARAAGTPVIDADLGACVVCEGLQCTHVCPSGALVPLSAPHEIRMGTAEVYGSVCVRSEGEACTICVERCPIGEAALSFEDDGPPVVHADACVGCGVCQLFCPTTPKAIVVVPAGSG